MEIRDGKVYYTAMGTVGDDGTGSATRIALKNITGTGTADASQIGTQGGPGNRIEVLYWKEIR